MWSQEKPKENSRSYAKEGGDSYKEDMSRERKIEAFFQSTSKVRVVDKEQEKRQRRVKLKVAKATWKIGARQIIVEWMN